MTVDLASVFWNMLRMYVYTNVWRFVMLIVLVTGLHRLWCCTLIFLYFIVVVSCCPSSHLLTNIAASLQCEVPRPSIPKEFHL